MGTPQACVCQGVVFIYSNGFLEVLLRLRQRISAHLVEALTAEAIVLESIQRRSTGRQDPSLVHCTGFNLERLLQNSYYSILNVEKILPVPIYSFDRNGLSSRNFNDRHDDPNSVGRSLKAS